MNKRQKKKDEFKHMWLISFKWKDHRKHRKLMERHYTYKKFFWIER